MMEISRIKTKYTFKKLYKCNRVILTIWRLDWGTVSPTNFKTLSQLSMQTLSPFSSIATVQNIHDFL